MKCSECKQSVELTDGTFEPAGMWPESTVKRYTFRCKDCIQRVTIDGGPPTQKAEHQEPVDTGADDGPPVDYELPPVECYEDKDYPF